MTRLTKKLIREKLQHFNKNWKNVRLVVAHCTEHTYPNFAHHKSFTDEHDAINHWRMLNEVGMIRQAVMMGSHPDTGLEVELMHYVTGLSSVHRKEVEA